MQTTERNWGSAVQRFFFVTAARFEAYLRNNGRYVVSVDPGNSDLVHHLLWL